MKIQSFRPASMRLIVLQLFLAASVYAQQPRFKVAAFYSTNGEMDHVNFAKDALYFFSLSSEQQQFTFDATRDWTNLNDDYLANYDLIVWLNDFPHSDEQREAFERYMNHGGAWLGCHVSAFNLPDSKWKWFNTFLGGAFFSSNNWPPMPAKVVVEDRNHPVTKRLPESYLSPTGEWYQWKPSPRENKNVKVLVTLDPLNYPLGIKDILTGGDTPVVWTNTKYDMIYMNMGHGDLVMTDYIQNNMITDALLWVGRNANHKKK